ncbi:MAG: hypothetical protein UY62_C0010G0022 [Parcubacteria group bacterium GW2011_GWF2_50_9]|nr:MAG: hypothetical protein UY62_C0010G0022 [Parcubacteria group bacterium GW2011_GWF2_50_9]
MKKILILDMSDRVAGDIEDKLCAKGLTAQRMCSLIQFGQSVAITATSPNMTILVNSMQPDIILNFHSQNTETVERTLQLAERCGVRIVNCNTARALCADRARLLPTLRSEGMTVPGFFYGHPSQLLASMKGECICKDPVGHLVIRTNCGAISSREELVYCETLVPCNGVVRSVYRVGKLTFTMEKSDTLGKGRVLPSERVESKGAEIAVVDSICKHADLDYCNVDFINGTVIDVNCFPNIFRHRDAVDAIVEHVASM